MIDYFKTTKTRHSLVTTIVFWHAVGFLIAGILTQWTLGVQIAIVAWILFGLMAIYEMFKPHPKEDTKGYTKYV